MTLLKMFKKNKVLIIILVVYLALSVYNINKDSLWLDETASIIDAKESIKNIIFEPNWMDQVPLYRILLHYWVEIFGDGVFVLRFFSALLGICAVLILYKIALLIFDKKAALLSSFLLSINLLFIKHSREVGKYTLFLLLTQLSVYFMFKIMKDKNDKKHWAIFIIFNVLNIYNHIFALFILLSEIVFMLLFLKKTETKMLILSVVLITLSFLPIIIRVFYSISFRSRYHEGPGIADGLFSYLSTLFIGLFGNGILLLIFLILIVTALVYSFRHNMRLFIFFIIWVALPVVLIYLLRNIIMDIQIRHFIFILPVLLIFAAYGLLCLKNRLFFMIILAIIIVVSAFGLNSYYNTSRLEWDTAISVINSGFMDGDIVIVSWWTEDLLIYYTDLPFINLRELDDRKENAYSRFWVLYQENYPTSNEVKNYIKRSGLAIQMQNNFGDIRLYLLSHP